MTRCGTRRKKRELRNIVRSSRFFLQPCCRSGWPRPAPGASCSSDARCNPAPVCSSAPLSGSGPVRISLRPASGSFPLHSRGGRSLSGQPALLRGPFVAVRCPFLLLPRALPLRPAGAPSAPPRRYRAAANSLSRAISSGQRSSSGVSRMSGMPSKRASEAM